MSYPKPSDTFLSGKRDTLDELLKEHPALDSQKPKEVKKTLKTVTADAKNTPIVAKKSIATRFFPPRAAPDLTDEFSGRTRRHFEHHKPSKTLVDAGKHGVQHLADRRPAGAAHFQPSFGKVEININYFTIGRWVVVPPPGTPKGAKDTKDAHVDRTESDLSVEDFKLEP